MLRAVSGPPRFASPREYAARRGDVELWRPWVTEILDRHGLGPARREPVSGGHATWPVFLVGDLVVKLFGYVRPWRTSFAAERAALARVAADPGILAPALVAEGRIAEDDAAPWPYLVLTRVAGAPMRGARLSAAQERAVAADLGDQTRRVHALDPSCIPEQAAWPAADVAAAARRSSLPPHLVEQVADYLAGLVPGEPVFVHGDLTRSHAFVEDGRLAGLIDWGDAAVTDRHYELIQAHRDVFDCDRALLRIFLDACDWPIAGDFARRALAFALVRQAVGLAQHRTMDVFEPVAARLPLEEIPTLDALAERLFGV